MGRLKMFVMVILSSLQNSSVHAFYCDIKTFNSTDYSSLLIVEGYVVDQIKTVEDISDELKLSLCNEGKICNLSAEEIKKFYKKYSLIENDIKFFVTKSYNSNVKEYTLVTIQESEFPKIEIGKKYIIFLVKNDDVDGFYIDPCSVIPINQKPKKGEYFFSEKPCEIRKSLIEINRKNERIEGLGSDSN